VAGLAACLRTIEVVTTCQRINDADWQKPERRSIPGRGAGRRLGYCGERRPWGHRHKHRHQRGGGLQGRRGHQPLYRPGHGGLVSRPGLFTQTGRGVFGLSPRGVGSTLEFTGSLVVGGGLQLMAAGNLDRRKTFIIATSLILAVSHQVYRSYFANLPHWLHEITGSMLSIATITASCSI